MKKKTSKEKKNQVIEIHIYVHQTNPNGAGTGGGVYIQPRCTCNDHRPYGGTSAPCPIHGGSQSNITLC